MTARRLAIVGTGAWGTALAVHGARAGLDVTLLGRRPDAVARLARERRHAALPDALVPESIRVTADPAEAFAGAEAALWAVSVQATAGELARLSPHVPPELPLVATSKGIETGSGRRPTEIVAGVLRRSDSLAVLSGPTFAAEVALGLPAAAVVASSDDALAETLQTLLSSPTFRLYRSDDPLGVEIAGAAKNVVAIAAGFVDGLKLGHNARAALLTRALAEIRRVGTRLGGKSETFSGLAGVGDLILTATGDLSRNRRVGLALAAGKTLEEALASLEGAVAEGVATSSAIVSLARSVGVEMPIAEMVVAILAGRITPQDALGKLMTRELKEESA